ncbi:MAG: lysophospholipid acyltransferase family protein [Acetobacteraceae bacterium]
MILLRSLLFNAWFFAITAVLSVTGAVGASVAPRVALPIARLWARLILGGLRHICGIGWEVRGLEHLPATGPALLASRHQSAFDTLIWLLLLPRCTYVAKRELLRIPLFGRVIRLAGQIAVDRTGGATALRALARDTNAAAQAGRQIIIFPEGTRAEPGRPLPLQPGIAAVAARTGLPVVPVVTDSGLRWGRRAFRKRPGLIHITLLPPVLPPAVGEPGARGRFLQRLTEALEADAERCG